MGHHHTHWLLCEFLSEGGEWQLGIISMHNFLNSFQVKNEVVFKPRAESQWSHSLHLQTSKLTLLKCPFQELPDLHTGVKKLW